MPAIVIVDNDDFKIDMLNDNATGAHGRIALYVQPESYKEESNDDSATAQSVERMEYEVQRTHTCATICMSWRSWY